MQYDDSKTISKEPMAVDLPELFLIRDEPQVGLALLEAIYT